MTVKIGSLDRSISSPFLITVQGETGSVGIIDSLAVEWRDMCAESPANQPFFQPEWARAFLSAFAPESRLLLVTARVSGRLTAVLPLLEQRRRQFGLPVTVLKAAANVHSCRFDVAVAARHPLEETIAALWDYLSREHDWSVIVLDDVPEEGVLPGLLACAERQGFPTARFVSLASPYFSLTAFNGDWDSWLSRLKGDFRRELRRRARKLAAQGETRVRRVDRAEPMELQRFYDLEASGWKGEEDTAITRDAATRQFYDEVAAAASRLGYFSLYFLEVNGRAIAGHFGLTYGSRYYVPKLAYDEEFAAFSPGHLLVSEVAHDCAKRGLIEFNFLGPWMDWKACWTSSTRRLWSLYIFRNDLVGRTLYGMKFGLKSFAKKILARTGRVYAPVTGPSAPAQSVSQSDLGRQSQSPVPRASRQHVQ